MAGASPDSPLGIRLDALRRAQNPDGGWGYFAGKQSWLEPTFYAALALHGEPAADRAWTLLQSWQGQDGSWRPAGAVEVSSWGTALCVTLAQIRGELAEPFHKGVGYLLGTHGIESDLTFRARARLAVALKLADSDRNYSLKAWPWKPNTASWVEPTSHTLIALKKAASKIPDANLKERIRLGEAQLFDVRCVDGGWNYGNKSVLEESLSSYPETTGVALAGLQGRTGLDASLKLAASGIADTTSPLGRAWLTIALRLHGAAVPEAPAAHTSPDLMIVALEALSEPEGNHHLLRTEATS